MTTAETFNLAKIWMAGLCDRRGSMWDLLAAGLCDVVRVDLAWDLVGWVGWVGSGCAG